MGFVRSKSMKNSREKLIAVRQVLRKLGVRATDEFNRLFDSDAEEELRIRIVRGHGSLAMDTASASKCAQSSGHLDFDSRSSK